MVIFILNKEILMDRIKKQLYEWDENLKEDFFFLNLVGMKNQFFFCGLMFY